MMAARVPPEPRAPSDAPALGDYVRLFPLGQGGMGVVDAALERRPGGFERVVALKRLAPNAAKSERHRQMFLQEARLAGLLAHPNVVHAFAAGETDGECFLAMEYVEGEPLSRVLSVARARGFDLSPVLVALLLADVAEGLHATHELHDVRGAPLNVVHRDVSPNNVMIAYEGHVKLLDFGVAKIEEMAIAPLTKTGEVKGRIGYMSPEQAMGDALDRRSDLYSLGAVLFECIAGAPMWGDGTEMEVLRRLALEAAPSLADAAPHAPRSLIDLHARLVASSPAARPATQPMSCARMPESSTALSHGRTSAKR
jgi:eukaryotic-like serine/threonine-protein kinase